MANTLTKAKPCNATAAVTTNHITTTQTEKTLSIDVTLYPH